MRAILYYYHDPMCSWCWGYRPTWEKLQAALPASVEVEYVLGGLAPDSDEPMPQAMQEAIAGYWKRIEQELGATFNFDFWRECSPRRDTYKSCRAVIAADSQGRQRAMIEAIQRAYYLRAMNPSEIETLVAISEEVGLNSEQFRHDLLSQETDFKLQQQIAFARRSPIRGFPSLALSRNEQLVAVQLDYLNHETTLSHINQITG